MIDIVNSLQTNFRLPNHSGNCNPAFKWLITKLFQLQRTNFKSCTVGEVLFGLSTCSVLNYQLDCFDFVFIQFNTFLLTMSFFKASNICSGV